MSDRAFAPLRPADALAGLAFSDVYDTLTYRRQNNQLDGTQDALRRMVVEPEQTCDGEIVRLRRKTEKRSPRKPYDTDGEASESVTEPDTDTEEQLQGLGMVWVGRSLLGLQAPPSVPERRWAAGKRPLENMPIDLLFCTRSFIKSYGLRNPYTRFNFFIKSIGFYIIGCSRSPSAQLTNSQWRDSHRPTVSLEPVQYKDPARQARTRLLVDVVRCQRRLQRSTKSLCDSCYWQAAGCHYQDADPTP